ncbi:MAG: hypothetical protein WA138_10135 [Parvibaculum sp.]
MARGRIFSSRRMFTSRRSAFVPASGDAGPFGVVLGLAAAAIIIFAAGIYVGRTYPSFLAFSSVAPVEPVTAAEF